jgi:hypothetical protein
MWLWCARVLWALLPVSAGGAIADALDGWSTAPARVATVLLWFAWMVGIVALFVPRVWGLTALRVVAPVSIACAVVASVSTSAGEATLAITTTVVATAFALSAPIAYACVNSLAYGDEVRCPLRIPTPLLLLPVPVAIALVAGGLTLGPILLADGRWFLGVVTLVVGLPVALLVGRSLHSLSLRWFVLVPAGVVVVDPLTILDPVLVRRHEIATLRLTGTAPPEGALDLRLGTAASSVLLATHVPHAFARRRGRGDATIIEAATVLVSVVRAGDLVKLAAERRIPTS